MTSHPLNSAQARVSDLLLDQRKVVMVERDRQRRADWLANRVRAPWWRRALAAARGTGRAAQ